MLKAERWFGSLAIAVCGTAVGHAGQVAVDRQVDHHRLHLQTIDRAHVPVSLINLAMRDVKRIWEPYDIAVTWGSKLPPDNERELLLRVVFQMPPAPDDKPDALAWIPFIDGHVARDVVYAAPGRVGALMSRPWRLMPRPRLVREKLIGQAIGRSVAHEIGHFLMASPAHAETGLMRPTFSQADLAEPGISGFALTAAEARRLDERLRFASTAANPDGGPRAEARQVGS